MLNLKRRSHAYLLALTLAITSQSVYALDLLDAWQAAQNKDPSFSAARAGVVVGRARSGQAKALKLPQVTASAGTGMVNAYNKIGNAQFSAPGMGGPYNNASFITQTDNGVDLHWNIRAEQPLYNAELATQAQQLNKQAEFANIKLSAEQQGLILRVAKAYFDVLLAEDSLVALKKQRLAVSQALAVAKGRFAEGDVAIIDTHEAQAREDALVAQELEVESNLQLAQAALTDLTGNTGDVLARLADQSNLQQLNEGVLKDWLALAQSNSPYLHMQQIQQGIAHDEIDKYRLSNSPVLSLVAQAGGADLRGSNNDSTLSNHAVSVGVQLTMPLFTGGMRNAKYEEAVALEQQSMDETEVIRLRAGQQARTEWLGVSVGKGKVRAMEQALYSSKVKLDATKLGREVGDRTILDEHNAEQDFHSTRTQLFRARYQMLLSYLSLAATAGILDEKRLLEVNAVLVVKQAE